VEIIVTSKTIVYHSKFKIEMSLRTTRLSMTVLKLYSEFEHIMAMQIKTF